MSLGVRKRKSCVESCNSGSNIDAFRSAVTICDACESYSDLPQVLLSDLIYISRIAVFNTLVGLSSSRVSSCNFPSPVKSRGMGLFRSGLVWVLSKTRISKL